MIRFTAAERAKAIEERSAEDFARRSYKPVLDIDTAPSGASDVKRFSRWLAASGLTPRLAAQRFGVSRQTIHNWKAKGAPPAIMAKLAE